MSQKKEINLTQMHINGNLSCIIIKNSLHFPQGLCNTVIDNPGQVDKQKLVTSVLSFLETDTVLFYGEEPPELLQAQMERWSPIILWFRERFGVSIEPTTNVMTPPVQECKRTSHSLNHLTNLFYTQCISADLKVLEKYLMSHSYESLQGFTFAVDALKSLILCAACVERRLTVTEAVKLARLETEVQTSHWGSVEWAHDIEGHDTTARVAAGVMFVHCSSAGSTTRSKQY